MEREKECGAAAAPAAGCARGGARARGRSKGKRLPRAGVVCPVGDAACEVGALGFKLSAVEDMWARMHCGEQMDPGPVAGGLDVGVVV